MRSRSPLTAGSLRLATNQCQVRSTVYLTAPSSESRLTSREEKGVLAVEDWAEIRRLRRAEGLPIKLIARTLGISRNTVRAALASDGPPRYERTPAGSAVDGFEEAIRAQLLLVPTMPATVIAERVGWTRGLTVFKERVRELRPAYLPPDPAGRTTYEAAILRSATCGFRQYRYRWAMGRPAHRCSYRC